MHSCKLILLVVLFQYTNNLVAQEKYEKESRIKQKDVPLKAIQFINSLNLRKTIKWYQEEGLVKKSIEAKFKHNKKRYSLEFDTLGNIEDLEVESTMKAIDNRIKDSISFSLNKECLSHKIVKIQIQYSGALSALFDKIKTDTNNISLVINYELIVKCKLKNRTVLYEYLFSGEGKKVSNSKIIFKNSSHLEY